MYGIEVGWYRVCCFSSAPWILFCFSYTALWPLISLFPLVGWLSITIESDDVVCRIDNSGFILWGYIPCHVIHTSLGWLWHVWACMVMEGLGGPICLFQFCATYTAACPSHTTFYHIYHKAGGWIPACWAHTWHVWCRDEFLFFFFFVAFPLCIR